MFAAPIFDFSALLRQLACTVQWKAGCWGAPQSLPTLQKHTGLASTKAPFPAAHLKVILLERLWGHSTAHPSHVFFQASSSSFFLLPKALFRATSSPERWVGAAAIEVQARLFCLIKTTEAQVQRGRKFPIYCWESQSQDSYVSNKTRQIRS